MSAIDELASWTAWRPVAEAVTDPSNAGKPGVYRVRHRETGHEFYVGCTHRRPVAEDGLGLRERGLWSPNACAA